MTKITRSSSKNIALYKNVCCCIIGSIFVSKLPQIYNEIHPLVHNKELKILILVPRTHINTI